MQKKEILSSFSWNSIEKGGGHFIKFIVFLALARLVSPSAFGLISLASAYIAILELFLDQGFSQFLIHYDKLEKIHLNTVFWLVIGTSILLFGGSLLLSGLVASIYHEPELENVINVLSLSLIISSFASIPKTILQKELSFKLLAYRELVANFISGIVALTLAYFNYGVWSLVGLTITYRLVEVILLWIVTDWKPQFQFSFTKIKQMLSFGISSMGVRVLKLADKKMDDVFIGYFLGSQALGYYTIAYKLVRMTISLLTGILTTVAFPLFSKLQNNIEKLETTYKKLSEYSSLFLWPIFIYIAVFSDYLILIFGEKWYPAHSTMTFLALGSLLFSTLQLNGSLSWGVGRHKLNFKYSAITTCGQTILFYFASQISILAVAIAYLGTNILLFMPLQLNMGMRILNFKMGDVFQIFKKPIISTIIYLLTIGFIYWLLSDTGLLYYYVLLMSFIYSIIYYGLLVFLNRRELSEMSGYNFNLIFKNVL